MSVRGTVTNQTVDLHGDPVPWITVTITLKGGPGFRLDDGGHLAPQYSVPVNGQGNWSFNGECNSNITPANTWYEAYEPVSQAKGGPLTTAFQITAGTHTLGASQVAPAPANPAPGAITQAQADLRYTQIGSAISTSTSNIFTGHQYFGSGRPWVDPMRFGADPTGATSSSAAFAQARALCVSTGSSLYVQRGATFLLDAEVGSQHSLLEPWSGGEVFGGGTLKAGPGLNTGANHWFEVIASAETTDVVNDFLVRDITIDFNGANNLVDGSGNKYNYGVAIWNGDNIVIDGVKFLNNPGLNSIFLGLATASATVTNVAVNGCYFHGFGKGVASNTLSTDHSCMFLRVDRAVVTDNRFYQDAYAGSCTAIEIHANTAVVSGNVGANMEAVFNAGAQSNDSTSQIYSDNNFTNVGRPFRAYTSVGKTLKSLSITNNSFVCRAAVQDFVDLYSNNFGSIDHVLIEGNQFGCTSTLGTDTSTTIAVGVIAECEIRDNRFRDMVGRVVSVFASSSGCQLVIEDNTIVDCGRNDGSVDASYKYAITLLLGGGTIIGVLRVNNNTCRNVTGTPVTRFLDTNCQINAGEVRNNTVVNVAHPHLHMTGTVGTDRVMIDHVGNGEPNITAAINSSLDSTWIDRTTGYRYIKKVNDGAVSGFKVETWGTAAPVAGAWLQGDIVFNSLANAGGTYGWYCTTSGSPGTWKAISTIAP